MQLQVMQLVKVAKLAAAYRRALSSAALQQRKFLRFLARENLTLRFLSAANSLHDDILLLRINMPLKGKQGPEARKTRIQEQSAA
jgi:hypothetical protein